MTPDTRRAGQRGVSAVVEQLQGFESAVASWEADVLPARVAGYRPEWLDALCFSGEVVWGRLSPRSTPAICYATRRFRARHDHAGGSVPTLPGCIKR